MSQLTHLNPLAALPAAEQHLIGSIDAVTSTLNSIGASALDSALARLEEATRAVHSRLGAAMGSLKDKIAGVVDALEGLGTGVMEELSTDAHLDRYGSDHRAVAPTVPAQVADAPAVQPATPPVMTTSTVAETEAAAARTGPDDNSPVIDLAAELPPVTETHSTTTESHQTQRQDSPEALFSLAIASQKQRQALEQPREAVVVVAACSPVEPPAGSPARDDRTATRRKPRRKGR